MPENREGDSGSGDVDSRRSLWRVIRSFFDMEGGSQSLRAQIEEAIDEHEEEHGDPSDRPRKGDVGG